MSKKVVIYGAGAIGRGYLAPLLDWQDYDLLFVDSDRKLIEELKKRTTYKTAFTVDDKYIFTRVNVKGAFHVEEDDEAIRQADFVFVSVGPRNAIDVAQRLKKAKKLFSFENERDSAYKIEQISGVRTYFGIPDVIASSTAPKKLLKKDPLCVVSELGDLIVEAGDYDLTDEIKQVPERDIDMYWACKFYLHNTPHAITAYLGAEKNYSYIHEAMADSEIDKNVSLALEDIKKAIVKKGLVTEDMANWYLERELKRFRNKLLYDPILRVGREPLRKLKLDDRLIGVAKILMEEGIDPEYVCKGIRAALIYDDKEIKQLKENIGIPNILETIGGLKPGNGLFEKIMSGMKT